MSTVIAVVYDPNIDVEFDLVYNVDTALSYISAGYAAQAVADTPNMTKEQLQELFDNEREIWKDCFE